MSNEEETNENKEQEKQPESAPENFEDIVETQEAEVTSDVESVKEAGAGDVQEVEVIGGQPEEVEETKEVAEETSKEAEDAKEEYYEELRNNIPNFDDKAEEIKKETEASEEIQEEYNKKLKDIPNASNLAESFKTEENVKVVEKTEETQLNKKTFEEEVKDQVFNNLNEINGIALEALNESKGKGIAKLNDALEKLRRLINNNKKIIESDEKLKIMINAAKGTLEKAKSIIEEKSDKEKTEKLSTAEGIEEPSVKGEIDENIAMKTWLKEEQKKGEDTIATRYIKKKLSQKSLDSEKKSAQEDLDIEIEKAEAEEAIKTMIANADKALEYLKKSEESPSGKISSIKGASSLLENVVARCSNVVESNKELEVMILNRMKLLKNALKEQEKLQAENDKLAAKYNV